MRDMGQFEKLQRLPGPPRGLRLRVPHLRRADPVAQQRFPRLVGNHHHQVFENGQVVEFMRYLEGAHDPLVEPPVGRKRRYVLATIDDAAAARPQGAGDHVENRGLAGPVGSDEAGDGAFRNRERTTVDGPEGAEVHGQILAGKDRRAGRHDTSPAPPDRASPAIARHTATEELLPARLGRRNGEPPPARRLALSACSVVMVLRFPLRLLSLAFSADGLPFAAYSQGHHIFPSEAFLQTVRNIIRRPLHESVAAFNPSRQWLQLSAFRAISSATSTIMSSWPPIRRRRPISTRIARGSRPYSSAAFSAWRRKLE